ncbi:MAG: hypothetical protein ACREJ5_06505 [Geminicoccaceae bacterium]
MNDIDEQLRAAPHRVVGTGPAVLQIVPRLERRGVERGTVDLARHLVERGWGALVVANGTRTGLERLLRRAALQGAVRHHDPRAVPERPQPDQVALRRRPGQGRLGDRRCPTISPRASGAAMACRMSGCA